MEGATALSAPAADRPLYRLDKECCFRVGGMELSLLAPRSMDDLMEEAETGDEIPFWGQVWDSAYGLCQYLLEQRKLPAGPGLKPRLLELGCGVGAVGCLTTAAGWDVTMSDTNQEALRYARRNLDRNGLDGKLLHADWRLFPEIGAFDLVVGSDILYEPLVHEDLRRVLDTFRQAGAAVILADPGRSFAVDFAAAREQDGWPVQLEFSEGRGAPITIYTFGP